MNRFNRVILGVGAATLLMSSAPAFAATDEEPDTYELLDLFGEVFELVREEYVEDVTDKQLIEAAIQGMLANLDPHSVYLNDEHFKSMRQQTRGEFGGLGIEVTMDETGYVRVVAPIDDTPAFRAGIEAGDMIIQIDDESVQGLTLDKAVEKMRGKVGSEIRLTISRGETEPFEVTIVRDRIKIRSVRSRLESDIAYIRISSFSGQTQDGLDKEIAKLREESQSDLRGLILDLRNNPGGLLDQAISVSDTFLEKGEIVSTRGRDTDNAQRFQATPGDEFSDLPIVVLINGGSASASEIVAGALQDHGRAIIMGTPSFGKGSVQTIMPLSRGSAAIKLTTQRYYTPSGRSIQQLGINPDILVERAKVELLERVTNRSEASLRGSLSNDQVPEEENNEDENVNEESDGVDAPNVTSDVDDYQLARAIDLIRGISLYSARAVN